MAGGPPKKKQRVGSSSRYPSTIAVIHDESVRELPRKHSGLRRSTSQSLLTASSASSAAAPAVSGIGGFNDPSSADVILRLYIEDSSPPIADSDDSVSDSVSAFDHSLRQIHLHSSVLSRSKYFSALFSDRWRKGLNPDDVTGSPKVYRLELRVSPTYESVDTHYQVLHLLYSNDFATAIDSASTALCILPVALELLFEDCVRACIRFLEAVPWTEEEEKKVMSLVPLLSSVESEELTRRLLPPKSDSSEEMLHELIVSAIHTYPSMSNVKAFVAKLLREFSPDGTAKRVLDRAFENSLKSVKQSLEEYSSPDLRGDHNETEAIQRLNLHSAMANGRHLLWLIERMIELKVADTAVMEWSDQASFTADLLRAFRDEAWRNIVPGLPPIILRCTSRLANAVASGNYLASGQVRTKLVKHWLPVLAACKDNVAVMLSSQKSACLELEETFLKIISTLPMSDSQKLLQQCLSFSTRNVEDSPHLFSAFKTWFRRANRS